MPGQTGGKKRRVRRLRSTKSRKRSTKKRTRSRSVSRRRRPSGRVKLNKWQRFLKKHGGKGHSQRTLRAMYRREYM